MKPIRAEIEGDNLIPFRILMVWLSSPFLFKIFEAFSNGVISSHGDDHMMGSSVFWSAVFKNACFALVLLWFATFGAQRKEDTGDSGE